MAPTRFGWGLAAELHLQPSMMSPRFTRNALLFLKHPALWALDLTSSRELDSTDDDVYLNTGRRGIAAWANLHLKVSEIIIIAALNPSHPPRALAAGDTPGRVLWA